MLERLGIDPSKLKGNMQVQEQRTLILDADGAAYRAAATAKTLPTVLRRFVAEVLEKQFLTNSNACRLHLTAAGGFKGGRSEYPSWRPYQGNRTGKSKPALLEPLRELLGTPKAFEMGVPEDWYINLNRYWEADDTCTMDSYILKDKGIVASDDKDLRMTPYPFFEHTLCSVSTIKDRFGYITEHPSGGTYPIGHGTKYFWLQMLMGDTADNIRGLDKLNGRNCGQVSAVQYIQDVQDESECANMVLWAYAKINQDALAEAQLLWMRRTEEDCALTYLLELDIEEPLKVWLRDLDKYHKELQNASRRV